MFNQQPILIVEDEIIIALGLALSVRELGGRIVGPATTVHQALEILDNEFVAAAILDANLPDGSIAPVALRLAAAGVPFVLHTGTGMPRELGAFSPDFPVIMKPASADTVAYCLWTEIRKTNCS
ncbi:MAG: response regulator [Novosphingobium sp.]